MTKWSAQEVKIRFSRCKKNIFSQYSYSQDKISRCRTRWTCLIYFIFAGQSSELQDSRQPCYYLYLVNCEGRLNGLPRWYVEDDMFIPKGAVCEECLMNTEEGRLIGCLSDLGWAGLQPPSLGIGFVWSRAYACWKISGRSDNSGNYAAKRYGKGSYPLGCSLT